MRHRSGVSRNMLAVPMDNMLLFLSSPGCVPTGVHPDCRSMHRCVFLAVRVKHIHTHTHARACTTHDLLLTNQPPSPLENCRLMLGLANTGGGMRNPYLMFCSPIMDRIICLFGLKHGGEDGISIKGGTDMVDYVVRCWWESVGMPSVLQHRGTARLGRRALRLDGNATTSH